MIFLLTSIFVVVAVYKTFSSSWLNLLFETVLWNNNPCALVQIHVEMRKLRITEPK